MEQAVVARGAFACSFLGCFDRLSAAPQTYRHLHWEAGVLGHILYLQAQKAGLVSGGSMNGGCQRRSE